MFLLLAIGAVVAFPLVMSAFGMNGVADIATSLLRWPVLFVVILSALAVLYRFGPSRKQRGGGGSVPGSVFATLAWIAGSALLSFYLSNFADYDATYGSLGAAIGLMMWMWLTTSVVLVGAELIPKSTSSAKSPMRARNVMRAGLWPMFVAARCAANPAAASLSIIARSS